jgi:hypothetical protein
VHEEVRGGDAVEGAREVRRPREIGVHPLDAAIARVGAPSRGRADAVPGREERRDERASDEPGRAGDEDGPPVVARHPESVAAATETRTAPRDHRWSVAP